jgi:hypothetical protein
MKRRDSLLREPQFCLASGIMSGTRGHPALRPPLCDIRSKSDFRSSCAEVPVIHLNGPFPKKTADLTGAAEPVSGPAMRDLLKVSPDPH